MANTLRFKRGLVSGIPTAALGEPLFTTDTFDLYIGNGTTNTRFQKYIASGTTSQLLRGDGSLLTMPIVLTSPSNGEVLKYNGTNWVNSADAGVTGSGSAGQVTYWGSSSTITGSNSLFWDNTNGRLGIGTITPSTILNIFGTTPILAISTSNNSVLHGIEFRAGTTFDASIKQLPASGELQFNVGRNSSWGGLMTFFTDTTEKMRLTSTGNLLLGSTTNNGLRFQVTGDGYFSGSVGIGTSSLSAVSLRVAKNITGAIGVNGIVNDGQIQTDVTNSVNYFYTIANTAASLTMTNLRHYLAVQGTFGAGTAITNQIGFYANSSMIGATNNYGFYGDLASGTGRWNLYLVGTAANHINGNLQLGSATAFASAEKFQLTGDARIKTTGTGGLILEATSGTETPNLTFLSTTNRYNLDNSSGTLRFFRENTDGTSGAVRMSLTDEGNLGLGVTPFSWASGTRAIDFGSGSAIWNPGSVTNTYITTNAYYDITDNRWEYKGTGGAGNYHQFGSEHRWNQAAAGTANQPITFTQAMTLDASGNLLVGNTTGTSRLDVAKSAADTLSRANSAMAIGDFVFGAGLMLQQRLSAPYGFMIQATNSTAATFYPILLNSSGGNVVIGATTDAGYKLDVNGTMRVSGASTFGGNLGVTLSQNATTWIAVSNPDTDTTTFNTQAGFRVFVAGLHIGSLKATSRNLTGLSRRSLYLTTEGLYDLAFGVNQSATPSFVIDGSTGAATFSSSVSATSVTAGGRTILAGGYIADLSGSGNDTGIAFGAGAIFSINGSGASATKNIGSSANPWGNLWAGAATFSSSVTATNLALDTTSANGSGRISLLSGGTRFGYIGTSLWALGEAGTDMTIVSVGGLRFATNDTSPTKMRLDVNGNLGIAMTPSYKLDVTGEARVSNAIAIGTTPDTNKPFKILKNINGTVGINFENTSTGSLAFSAIQMGTDVSGGTKFTNLVYASSGVTASGVYNPDGTSLINNGSGGLNFLGNPIRMYTGGSNGTLRWDMTNDGFITQYTGTNPSTNATDGYRQYSADVVAGNAAPHFRTENGAVIKLYQETTAVGNSTISVGGGNAVLDDTEFDGYTLRQIVKALRNQGILQ